MTMQAKKKVPQVPPNQKQIEEDVKLAPDPDLKQYQQPKIGGRSSS